MTQLENTFAGWAGAGRTVRRGEQARFYLVNPEDHLAPGVALFALDQTDIRDDIQTAGYERVEAAEYRRRRAEAKAAVEPPKLPVARCTWIPEHKLMRIWVGNHKPAIDRLKSAHWLFDLGSHRWRKSGVDPISVAQKLAAMGMRIEAEGFHFDQPQPEDL